VSGPERLARYEIRVDGVLDDRWADWFGGLQVSRDGTQTVIAGLLPDQPALHGLLAKVRDLGLTLISVRQLDAGDTGDEARQLHDSDPERAAQRCPSLRHAIRQHLARPRRQAQARGPRPEAGQPGTTPPPGTTTFSNRNRRPEQDKRR
jgi:hypothetical protein